MSLDGLRIGVSLPVRELQDDLAGIRDFAQTAEELGFTHLRVPDVVVRPGAGHLHEPLTLLSWVAALTSAIELVPSVIILPARQTALVAKQAAEIDVLSGGRLRLGVGVGGSAEEYAALGQDFRTRGRRCDEQIELLRLLWTQDEVSFEGRWDRIEGAGIGPLPTQRPIPIWIGPGGGSGEVPAPVLRRIGRLSDGWFAIIPPGRRAGGQRAHPRGSRGRRTRPLGDRHRGRGRDHGQAAGRVARRGRDVGPGGRDAPLPPHARRRPRRGGPPRRAACGARSPRRGVGDGAPPLRRA